MGGNIATNFKTIKPGSTRAPDKYTVEFNLPEKYPAFMASLFLFKITNKKLVMKNKQPGRYGENGDYGQKFLQTNEAGSGPFALVEHKHGDYLKGKRFEKYSLTKRQPNSVDEMIYYFVPEMVTMATRLQKGELDLVDTTIGPSIIREMKKNPNLVVEEHIWPATWLAVMNNKKPPLDDPYVRRAINYAFNRKWATNRFWLVEGHCMDLFRDVAGMQRHIRLSLRPGKEPNYDQKVQILGGSTEGI
jgi:peptide/nickel transport system substrate-binding protein